MPTSLSPWWLLAAAVPILVGGEAILRVWPVLRRFNVPVAVAGGLGFAGLVWLLNVTGLAPLTWQTRVTAGWWTWWVTPEPLWLARPAKALNLPLLVGFFTCVGLLAPIGMLRTGGRALVILLGGATLLSVLQNALGVAVAQALGAPPLLGVVCGALTLVGGHGTALGFASAFESAGFPAAAAAGAAAATFGLVAGGLLAGALAERLLAGGPAARPVADTAGTGSRSRTFFDDVRRLAGGGRAAAGHVLLVLACIKIGSWVGFGLERVGASLPVYMGALLVGVGVRAWHDHRRWTWLRPELIAAIAAVLLPLFLAVTLAAINLSDLASLAGPMLVILSVNTVATLAFCRWVVWPLLGRDHEAGVMVAGLVGFCVGSTATAVAAMDAIVRRRGPAPRAMTLVPPTGGFLIDLTNAPVIGAWLAWLR